MSQQRQPTIPLENETLDDRLKRLGWEEYSKRELTRTWAKRGKIIQYNRKYNSFSVETWMSYSQVKKGA
jgi:hypothetical protein